MMSEKEKRKNEVVNQIGHSHYIVLKIMGLIAIPYVLGIFAKGISVYPLMIMLAGILQVISPIIFYTAIFSGSLAFIFACFMPGFETLERLAYIGIISVLGLFIFFMSAAFTFFGGLYHVASIPHTDHLYYFATEANSDHGVDYYIFICDEAGIICPEKEYVGWGWYWDYSLQISADGKSIEVIEIADDGSFHVVDTYTPETVGTE